MPEICVVGLGYVGLSNAVLLAQKNSVTVTDIDFDKLDLIDQHISPIVDDQIDNFLKTQSLHLTTCRDPQLAYRDSDYVLIAAPTDYDPGTNAFNTQAVELIISDVTKHNPEALIIIKSTIPVGFIDFVREKYENPNIVFSPEFLREGRALYDNLHPSRIIVGGCAGRSKAFADLLLEGSYEKDAPIFLTEAKEAEAIKLFSNAYLAMRVAFFNELDTYALHKKLNTRHIIEGVSSDPRIGSYYNNPSFGYGGYCLPKDTKQLLSNYHGVPQNLVEAIVLSNETRQDALVKKILETKPKIVGVYRLIMKTGSDNFRASAIHGIIDRLADAGLEILVYEPDYKLSKYLGYTVLNNLGQFKSKSDVVIANRNHSDIYDICDKVFTRDIFGND